MHYLYSNKLRPDLPKLRNATIIGSSVEFLRYDPKDCWKLFNFNCNQIQEVKLVFPVWTIKKAWYFPNFKPDPRTGKMIPHPEVKLFG
jgi:hypothetical protein